MLPSAAAPGRRAADARAATPHATSAGRLAAAAIAWRAPAGAVAAGLLYREACPPHDVAALAWAIPALLLVPAGRERPRRAFACGLLFALVMGAGVTGWAFAASRAYFELGALPAAAFVTAVWLLCGGVQYGALAAAYAAIAPRTPLPLRPLAGAWLWCAAEWLRATLFTGMPWELLGHTQHGWLDLIQIADLGGVYAVSLVVALVGLSIGELLAARPARFSTIAATLVAPAAALAATLAYGAHARAAYGRLPAAEAALTIAVVQANLPSALHWRRVEGERALATYDRLSRGIGARDLEVWPEYATSLYLDREPLARAQLARAAARSNDGLILGAPRLATDGAAHNSAYLVDASGAVAATYDKRRLVPLAEYDPLSSDAAALRASERFLPGTAPQLLDTGSMRVGATLCYEILFPGLVRDLVRAGADVLVNLSNESWLDAGGDAASQQQLSMSVFAAVSSRRFLARAATTGVSAIVSPAGEILARVPAHTSGVATHTIALEKAITPYVRLGDAWLAIAGAIVLALLATARRRDRRARARRDDAGVDRSRQGAGVAW